MVELGETLWCFFQAFEEKNKRKKTKAVTNLVRKKNDTETTIENQTQTSREKSKRQRKLIFSKETAVF